MSDILSSFWKSIEKGWQSGASTSLPGPSVGRGLFTNPFLTERDRDRHDVRTLYHRVRSSYDSSIFADEGTIDAALLEIFKNACREANVENIEWALTVGHDAVRELLSREFLAFPELTEQEWSRLTLRDVSQLRALLLRKDKQLLRADETFDLACRAVCFLLTRLLEAMGEEPTSNESGVLTLEASVLDAIHEPVQQIEFAWRLFFSQELDDAGLFEEVREQLRRNTMAVCRIDPSDPRAASKVIAPSELKGRDPRELISGYLGSTPAEALFDAKLPVAVPEEVRFEHAHILGGSGHGKSQLLLHLIHHDLTRDDGAGLIVIDSQGDLVRTLSRLELFDPDGPLADRFVLIDPADVEYPVALSLFDVPEERLATYSPAERERLLNGVVEMYEYVFSSLLGAELTQKQGVIFRFLARLMMLIPGATLHTFLDLMEHGERFRDHMRKLDGTARRFFEEEFFHPSFAATKKQIAKRLWGILANPVFERMFSQSKSKLDLFEAMQARKLILISTAKDVLRQEGAEILGRFFLAKITQAVMERATLPLGKRAPCFIYIDEAQEYVDEQMALLLNQARKYRVGLTLAHQNLDQLPPALRASVMSSTSIKFAGGVSAKDARALADEMQADAEFLQGMRKRRGRTEFACYIRNRTSRAITVSIPLGNVNTASQLGEEKFAQLIEFNRQRICSPANAIDRDILQPARKPLPEAPPPPTTSEAQPIEGRRASRDPYVAGRGGQEHTYVQHLLRTAAQERGLKADVELPIAGGSVDVAIESSGRRVACEISITTDAEDEARNAVKCLAAGFDEVWLVVTSSRRKAARTKAIQARVGSGDISRIAVFTVAEALAELERIATPSTETKQVRGYTVTVRSAQLNPDESRRKREAIAAVLAKSLRAPKE